MPFPWMNSRGLTGQALKLKRLTNERQRGWGAVKAVMGGCKSAFQGLEELPELHPHQKLRRSLNYQRGLGWVYPWKTGLSCGLSLENRTVRSSVLSSMPGRGCSGQLQELPSVPLDPRGARHIHSPACPGEVLRVPAPGQALRASWWPPRGAGCRCSCASGVSLSLGFQLLFCSTPTWDEGFSSPRDLPTFVFLKGS